MTNSLTRWIVDSRPARRDIREVFNVVLFCVFGWSIRGFLFKMPALALYFGIYNDLAVLCYMLAFALVESLLVTGFVVLLSMLLPRRFLRDGFAYKGFLTILVATIGLIVFQGYYHFDFFKDILAKDYSSIPPVLIGSVVSIAAIVALVWFFQHQPRLQKYLLSLVDQFSVFSYIYVPLGLVGLVVVIIRNLV